MKPRIYFRRGVWCCSMLVFGRGHKPPFHIGHGYTPREAYDDWRAQI